jgi:hypothetical protein
MKKALRLLFLCKDALISPRTMHPISFLGEKRLRPWAALLLFSPVNAHKPPGYIPPLAAG